MMCAFLFAFVLFCKLGSILCVNIGFDHAGCSAGTAATKMIIQLLIPRCQRQRELKSVQRTQTRTRNSPPAIRAH